MAKKEEIISRLEKILAEKDTEGLYNIILQEIKAEKARCRKAVSLAMARYPVTWSIPISAIDALSDGDGNEGDIKYNIFDNRLTKDHIKVIGDTISVSLIYPRIEGNLNTVEVGLEDIRAADSIKIHFDFERDGYVIMQASKFEWESNDLIQDPDWHEVAFIKAWGREERNT